MDQSIYQTSTDTIDTLRTMGTISHGDRHSRAQWETTLYSSYFMQSQFFSVDRYHYRPGNGNTIATAVVQTIRGSRLTMRIITRYY